MFESCVEIRAHYSDYLDGDCTREAIRSLRFHLEYCASCRQELERQQVLLGDLRALSGRRAPEELALRLRVQLSQRLHRNLCGRLCVYLDNALKPLLLPASAGVLTTVLCFGVVIGSLVLPAGNWRNAPAETSTPPRVRELAPMNFPTGDEALVLVTHIDPDGRVRDYTLLSGQSSPLLLKHLDQMMFYSHFEPATLYGKPTEGQMVLSLRRITVRG